MSWISDAHAQWHAVHGAYETCPLDCGAMSPEQREAEDLIEAIGYEDETGTASIRCGTCPDRHRSAAAVRACGQLQALRDRVPAHAPHVTATGCNLTQADFGEAIPGEVCEDGGTFHEHPPT